MYNTTPETGSAIKQGSRSGLLQEDFLMQPTGAEFKGMLHSYLDLKCYKKFTS